jgi:hypothetical protein
MNLLLDGLLNQSFSSKISIAQTLQMDLSRFNSSIIELLGTTLHPYLPPPLKERELSLSLTLRSTPMEP